MNVLQASEIYNLISRGSEKILARYQSRQLRKTALESVSSEDGFKKLAFDTRRIDQETEYNPRRGLQNYSRSESFISEGLAQRIKNFAKLRDILNGLKGIYGREHEWQDSNTRILLTAIDNGLRTGIDDEDFATNQPGVGSFDYLDELLNVRYRLGHDEIKNLDESVLGKIILSKDEELTRKDVKQMLVGIKKTQGATPVPEITKVDVSTKSYDTLMEKLFSICAPSEEQPVIERTMTITIRDSLPNKLSEEQNAVKKLSKQGE